VPQKSFFIMPRTYSVRNPFKHQTRSERKRQKATSERDQTRNAESRIYLNMITRRRPQPAHNPPSADTELPSTSDDFHEPHLDDDEAYLAHDFNLTPYNAGKDTPEDLTVIEGWDSIPWTVQGETPQHIQPLDHRLTQEIGENHRQYVATSQNNKWNEIMPKLFAAYLWCKEKTANWTCTRESFSSFVHVFCNCQPTDRKSRQWIDCVDVVGEYFRFSKLLQKCFY
jgi:hypothetical protein